MANQRAQIEKYINKKYKPLQEWPWPETPNHTTFKHTDNKKWFGLIMEVPYIKLNLEKEGMAAVINLKNIPELIGGLRKRKGILPAYHMNKEHWISVLLDGTLELEDIYELIDISFELTRKKNK